MDITRLEIPDVVLIRPRRFRDDRGWFEESWNKKALEAAGIALDFVQDNHSMSQRVGTLRGLHFQKDPFAQAKLVRVARGRVTDFAVDIRASSPHYGKHVSAELSADGGEQLLVPRGFAHAFITREPDTVVCYKVDGFYDKASEGGIRFDDPDLGIDWGVDPSMIAVSQKDGVLPFFRDLGPVFD